MQIEPKSIKNILVVRNDRFGEFLLNIPVLRALKETFFNAKIITVINPYVRELAENIVFVDEIIEWAKERRSLSEKIKLIGVLKKKNIDIAIMLNPSKEFNILTYLSGIPIRVGYDRKWGFLLNYKIEDKKYLGDKHEIEYNLELISLIGARSNDARLSLKIDDTIIDRLSKDFNLQNYDNIVVIHPWTSDPIKQWPKEYFNELAERLIKELNLKVVIIGGRDELIRDKELFSNIDDANLINLAGKTTLVQLAAILKRAKLLISGDSGPVHLAGCVGTPVIAIFRNDIPGKSSTRWGPLSKGSIVIEKNNLLEISVDEVFNAIRKGLNI